VQAESVKAILIINIANNKKVSAFIEHLLKLTL